jgi:hypothetical protein
MDRFLITIGNYFNNTHSICCFSDAVFNFSYNISPQNVGVYSDLKWYPVGPMLDTPACLGQFFLCRVLNQFGDVAWPVVMPPGFFHPPPLHSAPSYMPVGLGQVPG